MNTVALVHTVNRNKFNPSYEPFNREVVILRLKSSKSKLGFLGVFLRSKTPGDGSDIICIRIDIDKLAAVI